MLRARLPPLLLAVVGLVLVIGFADAWLASRGTTATPWWGYLFLLLMAIAMLALAAAVTIDPRPLPLRRALSGAALAWLAMVGYTFLLGAVAGRLWADLWIPFALTIALAVSLAGMAVTTIDVAPDDVPDPMARLGSVVIFAIALVTACGAVVIVTSLVRVLWRAFNQGDPLDRLPWGLVILIVVLPIITFGIASLGSHIASGRTFYAQATANRRNSLLLVITMVGIVAATAEIVTATLTFDPRPTLLAAGAAVVVGSAAALGANRFGSQLILQTAGARPADRATDLELLNVVNELAIAANIPVPRVYIVADGSQNAFATGRDPRHAAVVVTTGLVEAMDREQLQGVIGHELGHIRNLDTRYALYVAVMVGLVALVTDGFLQAVVEGWKQGAFFWSDDDNPIASIAMGVLVGTFLLIVASLLRVVAPLFSALVQASTSREREFLADATSVEFTRNAAGLERAPGLAGHGRRHARGRQPGHPAPVVPQPGQGRERSSCRAPVHTSDARCPDRPIAPPPGPRAD